MAAYDPRCRMGAPLLLMLALGIPCLVAGCGDGESGSKPAPIDPALQKKVQQHLGGYREQLIAEAKSQAQAKAKAKANDAGKKTP
jgi:hypothetical protein